MSCDREFIDYDSHTSSSLGYSLPQDSLEMNHHQQNVPPHYMQHHRPPMQQHQIPIQQHQIPTQRHQIPIQQHQIPIQRHQIPTQRHQIPIQQHQVPIQQHQMRYPNSMQPGSGNGQSEPPPLSYPNRMPSIPLSMNQTRSYIHPQYRAQQMHLQQEQQRRHQQMLQHNMMSMQNAMAHRPQIRMNTPQMVVSPTGCQVPIQQQPRPQQHQQWRFHNVRSLAPGWNSNYTETTPPPLMPLEFDLTESASPTPNTINEEQGVDDFNDFDVTDLLRLTFGDENELNEQNSRKRKRSRSSGEYSPMKKHRRTRIEIIQDRNEKLMEQCTEFYIPLQNNNYPDHVRLFGKNIMRENMPNVPNMKLAPKNIDFYRVRNLGYLVTKKGICFSCLTDQCKFKSYEIDRFKEHLNTYHHVEGCGSREGYCKLCEKHCCGFSLTDEVDHILSTHVKSVDRHPMHQILYSHIRHPNNFRKTEPIVNLQEDTSNILNNMESDLTKRCEEDKRTNLNASTSNKNKSFDSKGVARKRAPQSYSIDVNYSPEVEDDEDDEENFDNMEEDSEPDINEFIQLSDEEEEEEIIDTESESESDESSLEQPQLPPELDEIPLYMLNRIKMQQSNKYDEAEKSMLDPNIIEAYEELMKAENREKTPKPKKKKRRRKTYFARKRTSTPFEPRLNKAYSIESVKDLPACRVLLTRLEDNPDLENTSFENTEVDIKVNKSIAVPINLPTPPSSENSRDSLTSPPINKRPSYEQISKDIENDSGLSDHSISNKSVINDDSNEKVSQMIDSNKINADHEQDDGNLRLTRNKFREKREYVLNVSTEKMKTRHSSNLQKSELSNNEESFIDDKENSGNKATNIEGSKLLLESPKSTQSPKKPRVVKKQRFLKKFHKIDNFFQKTEHDHVPEENDVNEVIEIQESPNILTLDTSTEIDENNDAINPTLANEPTDDPTDAQKTSTQSSLSLVIDEVMSISQHEDENELITLEELYPWIDCSITKLVKKSRNAVEILKEERTKFSTYKCMRQKCCYFTTNFVRFKSHTESYDNDGYNFCSFCLYKSLSSKELPDHIESNHIHDRYQCSLCMYRASEKAYVEWHQERFHVSSGGEILRSRTMQLSETMHSKILEELDTKNRKMFVLPYICKTPGCNKQFYNKNNYKSHLKQESDNTALSQCIDDICNQLMMLDQTRSKTFKEGYNQCLYCEYGSDDNSDINNHMADNHPNQLGFICRRIAKAEQICVDEATDNEEETIENQTRIEYIGKSSFEVKIYKGNDSLTSADRICAGDIEKVQIDLNDSAKIINDTIDEISNDKQESSKTSTFPIISEITHIDNF